MDEKRNSRRLDLDVTVELERINDNKGITTLKLLHVETTDLSKSGMGFVSKANLEIGSYYNTKLQIWTKENIDAIIEIVRCTEVEDGFHYGAKFIGMIESDALKIDIYQLFYEYNQNMNI
jgi:hypothetical protein